MAQTSILKAHQIQAVISNLQQELAKLDRIGAGIAAVHVNAAIEQLRTNLSMLSDAHERQLPPTPGQVPEAQQRIARAFAATTE